jgi:hypothetical protein
MTLLTDITFTDPQGVDHISATFGVNHANCYSNTDERVNRDKSDMVTMIATKNTNQNVNVSFYYWASEELRLAGNSPYLLTNVTDEMQPENTSFSFQPNGVEYDGLTLEEKCIIYLKNVILA